MNGTRRKAGDLLTDSQNVLNKWKNYSQLLNVHKENGIKQIEIHTAEPLGPDPSSFVAQIYIANLKSYKSPGSDLIPAEQFQILRSEINKLINFIWNKEELPELRKESIIVPSSRSASCCVSLYFLLLSVRTQELSTTHLHHMCKWVY
jgi:hypothetical protein